MKGKVIRSGTCLSTALLVAVQISGAQTPVVVTDGSVNVKPKPGTTVIVAQVRPLTSVSDSGTLTSAGHSSACGSGSTSVLEGYASVTGLSFGSYSPSTLTGGKTVAEVFDRTVAGSPMGCPTPSVVLAISGFTSSPGSSWVTSITCNSVKLTTPGIGFSYSSGLATWTWNASTPFGFSPGVNYTCTIVHNDP
jgi:hypothetical protein